MTDDLAKAINALRAAIYDAGPEPIWHARMMARHAEEWPALWKAIDQLLKTTDPIARGGPKAGEGRIFAGVPIQTNESIPEELRRRLE